jgi:hypothetical protein
MANVNYIYLFSYVADKVIIKWLFNLANKENMLHGLANSNFLVCLE